MRHSNPLSVIAAVAIAVLAACSSTQLPKAEEKDNAPAPPPASADASEIVVTAQSQPAAGAQQGRLGEVVVTRGRRPSSDMEAATPVAQIASAKVAEAYIGGLYRMTPEERENYAKLEANPVHRAVEDPVSTFSIDVDTGSYSNVRRLLNGGRLPPQDAVRVEELVNYFSYDYAAPRDPATPFGKIG